MSPVMCADDRTALGSCHRGPKVRVITARRLSCTFLLWLHFNSEKKKKKIPNLS